MSRFIDTGHGWVPVANSGGSDFEYGNDVINNQDPLGSGRVRHNVHAQSNPSAGVTETAAFYCYNYHGATWDTEERFTYALYGDQSYKQHLAGGSWSKVLNSGWGDAHFVALMNFGDNVPIIGASNTTPIVIETSRPHRFGHNNTYQVTGVLGNTAANSNAHYGCRVIDETHLALYVDGVVPVAGNGAYTGGGQITCINSSVGYEAAHFSETFINVNDNSIGRANGAVGFLSSIQGGFLYPSGLTRNKLFEALVENDSIFSGGCFIASDTPNRAFIVTKRQNVLSDFSDTAAGHRDAFALEEAYYFPQVGAYAGMPRWRLRMDAQTKAYSLQASALVPYRDAPLISQYGAVWSGGVSVIRGGSLKMSIATTGPNAGRPEYHFIFGDEGAETVEAVLRQRGTADPTNCELDLQSGRMVAIGGITMATAAAFPTQVDLQSNFGVAGQLGEIVGLGALQTPILGAARMNIYNQTTGEVAFSLGRPSVDLVTSMELQCRVGAAYFSTPVLLGAAGSGGAGTQRLLYVDTGT